MDSLNLQVVTPRRIVLEKIARSVTAPTTTGEITVLPKHRHLLTPLQEGIVKIVSSHGQNEYLAIGGGYLETDGQKISLLVSRAYGQDEIDKQITEKAIKKAEKIISQETDKSKRRAAHQILRISKLNLKLKKRHHR